MASQILGTIAWAFECAGGIWCEWANGVPGDLGLICSCLVLPIAGSSANSFTPVGLSFLICGGERIMPAQSTSQAGVWI